MRAPSREAVVLPTETRNVKSSAYSDVQRSSIARGICIKHIGYCAVIWSGSVSPEEYGIPVLVLGLAKKAKQCDKGVSKILIVNAKG
jgi:hypothetical protein